MSEHLPVVASETLIDALRVKLDLPTFVALYDKLDSLTRITTAAKALLIAYALEQGISEYSVFEVLVNRIAGGDGSARAYGFTRAREIVLVARRLGSATLEEIVRNGGMAFEQLYELAHVKSETARMSIAGDPQVYELPGVEIGARANDLSPADYVRKRVLARLRYALEQAHKYDIGARELCALMRECGYEIC
ncbi:MAG: hypothetical protein ACK4JD_13090 [Thermoflexales bacterium]